MENKLYVVEIFNTITNDKKKDRLYLNNQVNRMLNALKLHYDFFSGLKQSHLLSWS